MKTIITEPKGMKEDSLWQRAWRKLQIKRTETEFLLGIVDDGQFTIQRSKNGWFIKFRDIP
jgi:hypothetical protein